MSERLKPEIIDPNPSVKVHVVISGMVNGEMAELPNFATLFSLDGKVALVTGGT